MYAHAQWLVFSLLLGTHRMSRVESEHRFAAGKEEPMSLQLRPRGSEVFRHRDDRDAERFRAIQLAGCFDADCDMSHFDYMTHSP